MNDPELESYRKKLKSLKDKGVELKKDYDDLSVDKETAKAHRLALVKKENNQTLTEKDTDAITFTKDNYPDFFEEEVEQSDPEVETTSEYKERKQVAQILEYLNEEINSNKNELKKVMQEFKKIHNTMNEKIKNLNSMPESSSSASKQTELRGDSEKSKPESSSSLYKETELRGDSEKSKPESSSSINKETKLATKNEESSQTNVQLNQSTIDYIDSLPKQYNPMDDLGDD